MITELSSDGKLYSYIEILQKGMQRLSTEHAPVQQELINDFYNNI